LSKAVLQGFAVQESLRVEQSEAFSFRAGGFFQNNSSILPAFVQFQPQNKNTTKQYKTVDKTSAQPRHVLSAAVEDSPEVLHGPRRMLYRKCEECNGNAAISSGTSKSGGK
jgi:hypothetical protein